MLLLAFLIGYSIQKFARYEDSAIWGYHAIHSTSGKSEKPTNKKIKVAILDSGISHHAALKNKIVASYNAIETDQEPIDELNHGTAIAGIIGSSHNKMGFSGIAKDNVEIYNVKVLNTQGKSDFQTVINGIEWSIKNDVDIINISFGFETNNLEFEKVIKKALAEGIIIVAASGNTLGLRVDYPAKYEGVISVSALKPDFTSYSYSGKGKIDYAAPGKNILSTDKNGGYSIFNGTSFAAAFVTGSIAYLLGNTNEKINSTNLNSFLAPYVKDLGLPGFDEEYGHGFIQLN
ncbi:MULTISPECIES: S8 family peptidase [Lysinibacillus]|uniref:Peptidase S8 n=1 Tax=Lysinibacillus varians TaxID=1145276 RepID=A0ABY2TI02_9BACI|nr:MULTISPECIES: S8 family serine peptidase [Lysinibacillus]AHN21694.1 peptidase S8 [Lysinibacillus varians]MCS1384060.1 S8 family serine peptidase [Lysinibacillus sphaericus]TKI67596.1 peptidase S8 [Lysinibacillus varians]